MAQVHVSVGPSSDYGYNIARCALSAGGARGARAP
eukprot:SAG31_NODE_25906_length_451_cov_16.602273_1_plen_34_part_01